jgi:hypothetical protein
MVRFRTDFALLGDDHWQFETAWTAIPLRTTGKNDGAFCEMGGTSAQLEYITVRVGSNCSANEPKENLEAICSQQNYEEFRVRNVDLRFGNTEEDVLDHNHQVDIGLIGHEGHGGVPVSVQNKQKMCGGAEMDQLVEGKFNVYVGHEKVVCKLSKH